MRRLLLPALVAALAVPAVALATPRAVDDGTLVVKNADGYVFVTGRGAIIGSCDHCKVRTYDPDPTDGANVVTGYEDHDDVTDAVDVYTGTDVRFRIIGGIFRMRVWGSGIELGVVAKGWGRIRAYDSNTGWYSVNGQDSHLLPDQLQKFTLLAG